MILFIAYQTEEHWIEMTFSRLIWERADQKFESIFYSKADAFKQ